MRHALLRELFKLTPFDTASDVDTRAGELHDLLNGDIPYFHLAGDEPYVLHELGAMSRRNDRFTLNRRIQRALDEFQESDVPMLVDTLQRFLSEGRCIV